MKKIILFFLLSFFSFSALAQTQCLDKNATLQVLGSGGPIPEGRSSSGYIFWWKGKSKFLIDAGGGVFLRFGQAGASIDDLDLFSLSHFHTDHSADFPAILKSGYFSSRTRPLKVAGPTGSDLFPSLNQFLEAMIGKKGAYAYLNGFLTGENGLFKLESQEVSSAAIIYQDDEITVRAIDIPHGIVPAIAHRIETPQGVIVISSDQNGTHPDFIEFSQNADMLILPMAIPEESSHADQELHMPPDIAGKIAQAVNPQLLILTHFMGPSLRLMNEDTKIVQSVYKGPIFNAQDLECFPQPIKKVHHE